MTEYMIKIGIVASIILIILVVIYDKKKRKIVADNFKLVAKVLNSTVEKKLTKTSVRGHYQDREVMFSRDDMEKGVSITISMKPNTVPKVLTKVTALTEKTQLVGKEIHYKRIWSTGIDKPRNEKYIVDILEDLRKAVTKVESGNY